MRRLFLGIILAIAAGSSIAPPARALDDGRSYPRLAIYAFSIERKSPAAIDSIARYDLVVSNFHMRPEAVRALRKRNPGIKLMMALQPQIVPGPKLDFPVADTAWSPIRRMQFYTARNGWYLKDTQGRPIHHPKYENDWIVNWTKYCPRGVYGSSKGLRAAEWYPRMLAEICLSGHYWAPWKWDQTGFGLNGVEWEVLADCFGGTPYRDLLCRADPDQDGRAEGVCHICSEGGRKEPLARLFHEENEVFRKGLRARFPASFVFTINDGGTLAGPPWQTEFNGMKLENWDRWGWRQNWYGVNGHGYLWAERRMGHRRRTPDSMKGWDLTLVETNWRTDRSREWNERNFRFVLGTTMLGDGYFMGEPPGAHRENDPFWRPEYWSWGRPMGRFSFEVYGPDTLFTRDFERGWITVNPNDHAVGGVPAMDARFEHGEGRAGNRGGGRRR